MADLTSLWHAAAPPPPPPSSGPVSSSSIDTLSGTSTSRSSRPSSPSKSPLHRVLRSISPSPSQSNIPRTRSQSLGFDAHTRGDDLPADTHSPSPELFKKPQHQPQHHHTSYDSGIAARQRTMSYTPGDQYAPFTSHQQPHPHQPYAPHFQPHSVMSSSSSHSLHGQYMQHQQPQYQQTHQQQPYTYHPNTGSPTAFAPPSPSAYQQQDPRSMSPMQYSSPASPTHHTSATPQHGTTPPVSRSAYYSTAPSRHSTIGPAPTPPPRSRSPLPTPVINGAPSAPSDTTPSATTPTPPSAYEAWRIAQMQQQQRQQGVPIIPTAPHSQQQTPPQPPVSVPFPNGAAPSSPTHRSSSATTGTIRRALPRPPAGGAAPTSPIPSSTVPPANSTAPSTHSVASSPHSSSPSTSSTLSRTDSVRQAAEELMSRGVPRRGGARGFSRFNQASRSSPLGPSSSTSSGSVGGSSIDQSEQEVRSSQSEPAAVGGISGSRLRKDSDDNVADGLAQRFQQSTTIAEEHETAPDLHHSSTEEATASKLHEPASFQPPPRPSSRGAHHDVRSQGFRGPPVTMDHVPSPRPATFASAQQEAQQDSATRAAAEQPAAPDQPAALTPAADIPKVFSPPPNAAPPMPSIVFGNDKDVDSGPMISVSAPASGPAISVSGPDDGAPNGPSINVSGPEDANGPSISVSGPDDDAMTGPSINISGPDDQDDGISSSITPSVSLSHTADHVPATPQRASATTAQSIAQQQHVNGHTHNSHQHDQHHHHHHHHHHPATPCQNGHANAPPPTQTASSQTASSVAGAVCGGCSKYIAGRVVQAIGQCFHPDCFSCNHCGELLEHVAFYEHDGKAYCHFDYHELFSLRCFHCRTPIVDERFIQISDPDLVAGKQQNGNGNGNAPAAVPVRYYHDLHFFCANCGDPFMDPKRASSTAGSQRGQIQVDDQGRVISGSKAFVVWKGYPYCEGCHHNLHKPRCKSCTKPILHDVITALKGKWHPECFVCTSCKQPYPDERVFVDSKGNGYDEECYKVWLRSQL